MKNKIKTAEEIEKISEELRKQNKVIVTTNGCFDILHVGHIHLFEQAKKLGDVLIVLLNSDDSVKKLKGEKRPIVPQEQRAKIIAALEDVNYVVIFDEERSLKIMEKIKPDKHIKSEEKPGEGVLLETELLKSWGGERIYLNFEEGYSTTNIIQEIIRRYV
ncbi:hypothetical protein A3K73_01635 [Candidatus Pacearchaeota archaeon RBG_13_36_9]|nr:MAG: hypothetical protein A3K73_01635 [Candidatus Pacearchaeota archaeon RBG_13_36_9]